MIFLFAWLEFSTTKNYFNSKKWTPEYVEYGSIIDKYIKHEKNDDDYYIIVHTNSCNLRYKVKSQEYENLTLNDELIIFAIAKKQETFFSKNRS